MEHYISIHNKHTINRQKSFTSAVNLCKIVKAVLFSEEQLLDNILILIRHDFFDADTEDIGKLDEHGNIRDPLP